MLNTDYVDGSKHTSAFGKSISILYNSSLQKTSIKLQNNGLRTSNFGATLPCSINTNQQLTLQVNYREARQLFKKRRPVRILATTTVLEDLYNQFQKR